MEAVVVVVVVVACVEEECMVEVTEEVMVVMVVVIEEGMDTEGTDTVPEGMDIVVTVALMPVTGFHTVGSTPITTI